MTPPVINRSNNIFRTGTLSRNREVANTRIECHWNIDLVKKRASTEMENMALAGIISTQLLYHQYILKDNFRPQVSDLKYCRVFHEQNPIYS